MLSLSRGAIVLLAVAATVVLNLTVFAAGRAAGATYRFTSPAGPAQVDALTVAGFSAVPLLAGLTVVALTARFTWITRTALVAGPALAIATIPLMTLPTDFDGASKTALALCHLTLAPIIVFTVLAIRAKTPSDPLPT